MNDAQTPAEPEAPNKQAPHTQVPDTQAPGSQPTETQPVEPQPNEENENRGSPPGYGNGEVTGAGGSGAAEDYDADPAGGGGSFPPVAPKTGQGGADEPHGGTR